jgi:hypothetical protein
MGNVNSYIFKKTHMPYKGWLQGCFLCDNITGFTEKFTANNMSTYIVYICKSCQNNKKNNIELTNIYEKEVFDWILTHTG